MLVELSRMHAAFQQHSTHVDVAACCGHVQGRIPFFVSLVQTRIIESGADLQAPKLDTLKPSRLFGRARRRRIRIHFWFSFTKSARPVRLKREVRWWDGWVGDE